MATLGDFINNLAKQAGIPADDKQLIDVLSSDAVRTTSIPDDLAGNINKAFYTLDAARNNDTLKDHYYALFAKGGEAHLRRLSDEMGWDSATVEAIMAEKNLMGKYAKAVETVKATASKTAKPAKEVEEQISKLHADLKAAQEAAKSAVEQERSAWVNRLQSQAINGTLASFDYGLDLPKEIAIDTANALLNRKLAEAKYKVGYDPETNSISLLTEAGMLAYENNTPVDFKGFASRILADNKLLKVAAPAGGPPQHKPAATGWNQATMPAPTTNGKPAPDMSAIAEANRKAAESFS
jgi:hypothetical protein